VAQEDIKFPDVNYGEKNKDRYHELTISEWSPFFEHNYWEIFIFCMSYAYAKGLEPEEPSGKGTLNAKMFLNPTRYLMRSLAIDYYKDILVIKDSNKVVKICEKFANTGFQEVYSKITNNPSEKPLDSIFIEMINEINKDRD